MEWLLTGKGKQPRPLGSREQTAQSTPLMPDTAGKSCRARLTTMAGHESARTTGLYNRKDDEVTLDEVNRIQI